MMDIWQADSYMYICTVYEYIITFIIHTEWIITVGVRSYLSYKYSSGFLEKRRGKFFQRNTVHVDTENKKLLRVQWYVSNLIDNETKGLNLTMLKKECTVHVNFTELI